jgi:hypothetical protein
MLLSAFIGLLVGIALGQRYRVLILAPVIAVTLALAMGAAIACHWPAWTIALGATGAVVGLQIGYVLGIVIRAVVSAARGESHVRPNSFRGPLPTRHPSH